MSLWSFAPTVEGTRATALLNVASFDEVLRFLDAAVVFAFRWKDFENERLRGCYRAEYALIVAPSAYDAFFNAPVGLRAQYALSPRHGEAANRRMLSSLLSRLLEFRRATTAPSETEIAWSLCGSQAKIWIDEQEVETQLGSIEAQINYVPWARNSESGVGLLAPRGSRLEVKGGWLNPDQIIVDDPYKASRSEDIHREGYS
jgi:hypothetical protein